jgi:hypothetical protein
LPKATLMKRLETMASRTIVYTESPQKICFAVSWNEVSRFCRRIIEMQSTMVSAIRSSQQATHSMLYLLVIHARLLSYMTTASTVP